MEFKDLVPILVQIVLIPLLTALTGVAVKWINSKANELSANTDNIYLRQVIGMLNDSISTAVVAVNQTYVEELKKENAFTPEAQKVAFEKVYQTAMNSLTEQTKAYLNTYIGDIEQYVKDRIEQEVVINKE